MLNKHDMHIVVFGAGAIGCLVGGELYRVGVKVSLLGRKTLRKDVDAANGKLCTKLLGQNLNEHTVDEGKLVVTSDSNVLKSADIIIVSVKSTDTVEVAKQINSIIGDCEDSKIIISFQNGVRNPQLLQNEINPNHIVLPGLLEFNAVWGDKATFSQTTSGKILIKDDERATLFVTKLVEAGFDAVLEKDILAYQYGKLLINLNNAVNALSGVPLVETLKEKGFRNIVANCITEALNVFSKAGITTKSTKLSPSLIPTFLRLPNFVFNLIRPYVVKVDPSAKLSMLQDLEKGKVTEIDFLNGEVVKVAEEHDLPKPKINALIVKLVHDIEISTDPKKFFTAPELLKLVEEDKS